MSAHTNYVNWVEIAWTFLGVFSAAINLVGISSALKDRAVVKVLQEYAHYKDGITNIISHNHVRTEIIRFVSNCFMISIGIVAMTIAPSPYPSNPLGWLITSFLFAVPVGFNLNSFMDRYSRHKVMNMSITPGESENKNENISPH